MTVIGILCVLVGLILFPFVASVPLALMYLTSVAALSAVKDIWASVTWLDSFGAMRTRTVSLYI